MSQYKDMLIAMDNGALSPSDFSHKAHIGVAFEALKQDEFFTASKRIADGLKRLTIKAGVPEKFHATITQAYMSAIAQRMHNQGNIDAGEFLEQNADLLSGAFFKELYSESCLASPLAREIALLPDRVNRAA